MIKNIFLRNASGILTCFMIVLCSMMAQPPEADAQECFIGEVRMFAGTFAPRSWAFAHGQLLPISQNTALFSIIGTIYGGDGRTTFALPDLRSRVPVGVGQGPGLSRYREGQRGGIENALLNVNQIPSHSHASTINTNSSEGNAATPEGHILAKTGDGSPDYTDEGADSAMAGGALTIQNTGGNQTHINIQPYLGMNYIICLQGIFPSRN